MKRRANAEWQGSGKDGKGYLATQSLVLNHVLYTYKSRFEEGHRGTNPEELIAAAHAGCFSMKLAFVLNEAGFDVDKLETTCEVTLDEGWIKSSHLILTAYIKDIGQDKFMELVDVAKNECPVSKSLSGEITVEARIAVETLE